jgi:hypothetical protein
MLGRAKLAGWLPLFLAAAGCESRDADILLRIANKATGHVEALVGGTRGKVVGGVHAVRGSLGESTADSRVATRLRWDRLLVGSEIQVFTNGHGSVRLEGTVPDASAREWAVNLARSTAGVETVIDNLTIPESASNP